MANLGTLRAWNPVTMEYDNVAEPFHDVSTPDKYYRGDKTLQVLNGAAVINTPAGAIAAVTVQAAINELDTEKEPAVTVSTSDKYYRGDKSFQALNGAAVSNTPAGAIAAVTVQAAINELDSEKLAVSAKATGAETATGTDDNKYITPKALADSSLIVTNFVDLADVPANYTSAGGKIVKVKADASGLEFVAGGAGVSSFNDLDDVPANYAGQAGLFARVNATENGLEYAAGTPYVPLGYNFGIYVTYKDADEIYIQPGNIDVNGTNVTIATQTAHTMTSMVNATEDFHYIYLAAAGTITDATTEPAWSDAKFGWYNGVLRCIGAVWVPSATPAILASFANTIDNQYRYNAIMKVIVNNGNPTGLFIDVTCAAYTPVTAINVFVDAMNYDTNSVCMVIVTNSEDHSTGNFVYSYGYAIAYIVGWVTLGPSRNLAWAGEDDDNNTFNSSIYGYQIRV